MRPSRIAIVVFATIFCALAVVRPHVAERWGLYLGSATAPDRAVLFLDPFPSDATCETRVKVFAASAERAFCRGRRVLEFGTGEDAVLAADFDPFSPASWFCRPRRATKIAALSPTRGGIRANASGR